LAWEHENRIRDLNLNIVGGILHPFLVSKLTWNNTKEIRPDAVIDLLKISHITFKRTDFPPNKIKPGQKRKLQCFDHITQREILCCYKLFIYFKIDQDLNPHL
jgi:hypothetical protein